MSNPISFSTGPLPSRKELTEKNLSWKNQYPDDAFEIKKLEAKFGDYLYLPLDIPKIEVPEDFVSSFFEKAKYAYKRLADVASPAAPENAGGGYDGESTFLSIDSHPTIDKSIWTKNFQEDFLKDYKCIFDQIHEYFPLKTSINKFALWSSTKNVALHRDQSSFLDMPTQFRVMLYNSSPTDDTTLRLRSNAPEEKNDNYFKVRTPPETNSFAWNNFRAIHGSEFSGNKKILFIPVEALNIDWNRYNILLERSFIKYHSYAFIDTYKKEHYIDDTL